MDSCREGKISTERGRPVQGYEGGISFTIFTPTMSERDFTSLSRFIHDRFGISIPPSKKFLLESRLLKRLRKLNMSSFKDYCNYLFTDEGMENELVQMIDLVTTNKTAFFREPAHFDYLTSKVLPEMMENKTDAGMKRPLRVWSAGCSSGEEPYTLAMVLAEFSCRYPEFKFQIIGTDLSTRVLEKAQLAIYEDEAAAGIPLEMRKKYLMRSKNRKEELVRIVPPLRELVGFRRLNLMEDTFGLKEPMDIIFCRNVIIYFDKETQQKLLQRLCNNLSQEGLLFMGHSETLNDLGLPLCPVFPSVYRKKQ